MVQIERKRLMMYQAYENDAAYDTLIQLSTELDHLLNQLAEVNQKLTLTRKAE